LTTEEGQEARKKIWNNIMQEEFDLVYYGNFSYSDVEEMSEFERSFFYNKLLDSVKKKTNNK